MLALKSRGPWFKSSKLQLSPHLFSVASEFNSSTALCKEPTGQPPISWEFICLFTPYDTEIKSIIYFILLGQEHDARAMDQAKSRLQRTQRTLP